MMGTNNVTMNDPMQVCDLLFGEFCVDAWSIKWFFLIDFVKFVDCCCLQGRFWL